MECIPGDAFLIQQHEQLPTILGENFMQSFAVHNIGLSGL